MSKINIEEVKEKAVKVIDANLSLINGNSIELFRKINGLSPNLLADYLGCSEDDVCKWESGEEEVPSTIKRLLYLFSSNKHSMELIKQINVPLNNDTTLINNEKEAIEDLPQETLGILKEFVKLRYKVEYKRANAMCIEPCIIITKEKNQDRDILFSSVIRVYIYSKKFSSYKVNYFDSVAITNKELNLIKRLADSLGWG